MRRPNSSNGKPRSRSPGPAPGVVEAWWNAVIAGEADEPHPIHGERLKVHLKGERLVMSGELGSQPDREELLRQAKQRIGHGVRDVDASGLKVAQRPERRGILDQTLVAAFREPEVAELVRDFVIQHARITPKVQDIVHAGQTDRLRSLLPVEFARDAENALKKNKALLILRVDETDAFNVRKLLEEDTGSTWTLAMPPQLSEKAGA